MKKTGFTLLEVIITVVIIGILAAIAAPNYQNVMNDTSRKDATTNLLLLYTAQQIYFAEWEAYRSDAGAPALNNSLNIGIIPGSPVVYNCNATLNECTAFGGFGTLTIELDNPVPHVY